MVNGTREARASPTKLQTSFNGGQTDSPTTRPPVPDDTWSPRSIKAAYTAQAVKSLLIDEVIPSYPSVSNAFQRMNVFGENAIRSVITLQLAFPLPFHSFIPFLFVVTGELRCKLRLNVGPSA
jgi:outer membrane phospholipase A